MYNLCSYTGPHALQDPKLGFMLCCCGLKVLCLKEVEGWGWGNVAFMLLWAFQVLQLVLATLVIQGQMQALLPLRPSLASRAPSLEQAPMIQHVSLSSLVPPLHSLFLGLATLLNWLQNDA